MLVQLSIRDIVLIERLDIMFETGLSVLTGETGAGKSVLLDCLSLALGVRGDASLVRYGARQGQVTAVFDIPDEHPAKQMLRDNGLEDEGSLVLRRLQSADGRSRVFINDQAASVGLMRDVGRLLVEIHGQHADRALVEGQAHRALLDAFGGLDRATERLGERHHFWKKKAEELIEFRIRAEEAARDSDYFKFSVEELAQLDPQPGEEERLAERRLHMIKSEKIAADIKEAADLFSGTNSPVSVLAALVRRLERRIGESETLVAPVIHAIDQALDSLGNAQDSIEAALQLLEFDPRELELVEERLFALRAAARKYAVPVESLSELREKMETTLASIDDKEIILQQLEKETATALFCYDADAKVLSEKRAEAAHQLEQSVMAELPALKLEQAEFIVEITTNCEQRGVHGIDRIEFRVRTNPGTNPGPLMKQASGGELSRFLLALKVALADRGSAPTLVFDEIDTGVGGAVADSIGQRLKRLSENVQVLAVTHAPQVAARADVHFLISKAETDKKDRITTQIHLMKPEERQEEIARMLAGAHITDEARAAAGQLLIDSKKSPVWP